MAYFLAKISWQNPRRHWTWTGPSRRKTLAKDGLLHPMRRTSGPHLLQRASSRPAQSSIEPPRLVLSSIFIPPVDCTIISALGLYAYSGALTALCVATTPAHSPSGTSPKRAILPGNQAEFDTFCCFFVRASTKTTCSQPLIFSFIPPAAVDRLLPGPALPAFLQDILLLNHLIFYNTLGF